MSFVLASPSADSIAELTVANRFVDMSTSDGRVSTSRVGLHARNRLIAHDNRAEHVGRSAGWPVERARVSRPSSLTINEKQTRAHFLVNTFDFGSTIARLSFRLMPNR
jgi:hypothetical protein